MEDDRGPETPEDVADHLGRIRDEARRRRENSQGNGEDQSRARTTPSPYQLLQEEETLLRARLRGATTDNERTVYRQGIAQTLARKEALIEEADRARILTDIRELITATTPYLAAHEAIPANLQNRITRTVGVDLANTPEHLRDIRRLYFEEQIALLNERHLAPSRPEGMPSTLSFLATPERRRGHLDERFEELEERPTTVFGTEDAQELIESIRWSIDAEIATLDRMTSLTDTERAENREALEAENKRLYAEIRARHWLHNLHQQVAKGEFGSGGASEYMRELQNHLPAIYGLPGVADSLNFYQGTNGRLDYEYFRLSSDHKNREKQRVIGETARMGSERRITNTSLRLGERLLTSLGVTVSASLVLKEPLPAELRGLHMHERLEQLRGMAWEDQVELIDFERSFKDVPNDLTDMLFFGYRLEAAARTDLRRNRKPRYREQMMQDMNFPIRDYLDSARRTAGELRDNGVIVDQWPDDTRSPTIADIVERIELGRNTRATYDITNAGPEDIYAISQSIGKQYPIGPGNEWTNALSNYKKFGDELKKFVTMPVTKKIRETIALLGDVPGLTNEQIQPFLRSFARNTCLYVTIFRNEDFPQIPNEEPSYASALLRLLRLSPKIPLSSESVELVAEELDEYGLRVDTSEVNPLRETFRRNSDLGNASFSVIDYLINAIFKR